jgi:Rieske 2Fe-2S family protein
VSFKTGPAANVAEIAAMVERREVGYSLEAPFYASQEVYDLDLKVIFGEHWLFVAAEAEIPEPGDFVTVEIDTQSLIIVRDDDEEVRALRNVCRHRGSRVLEEPCGSVGNLVCPYHQWTYRTDGDLIFAEGQSPSFDKKQFGLKQVHVRTVGGLIFVCLAEESPADFDEVAAVIEPYLTSYRLKEAKVAHQTDLVEAGNWKLVMENNRECHHCDASHPELITSYFPFLRYSEDDVTPRMQPIYERYLTATANLDNVCKINGVPRELVHELDTRTTGFMIMRLPLDGDGASFGVDGAQVCKKLIGDVTTPQFGDLSLHMQPNSWFHFLSDHVIVFSVLPLGPDKSMVRTTWLVHPDAVEGVDYDIETLTGVWKATNDQDRVLVEKAQRGVTDPSYVPGPYALVEDDVESFINWYVGRLHEHLAPHHEQLRRLNAVASQ